MRRKFSIRTLLVSIVILAGVLAVVVPTTRFIISQFTDTLSPSMSFVWLNGGTIETGPDLNAEILAKTIIGNQDLVHVRRINTGILIDLSDAAIDDDGLSVLYRLRARTIDLTNSMVTREGVS